LLDPVPEQADPEPERFIVANEHEALVIMPPHQVGTFDSAVVFHNDETVVRVNDYVTDLYNCSQQLTLDVLHGLRPLHSAAPPAVPQPLRI
jgi:hypothetical protein